MIASLLLAASLTVGADSPPTVPTRLRSIALFKNGYAFYVREAACPAVTSVDVAALPPLVHGTFWISSDPKRLGVVEAVGRRESIVDIEPAADLDDLLRANVGRPVVLDDQAPTKILRLLDPPSGTPNDPYRQDRGLMIIETPRGERAVARRNVTRIESLDGPLLDRVERTREGWKLRVKLSPHTSAPSPLVLSYLGGGASWAPSYVVDLADPKRARLTAKAEVISEGVDLENTDIRFVTGFPNLAFRAVTSPMAMQGDLAQFLGSLYGSAGGGLAAEGLVVAGLPANGRNFAQLSMLSPMNQIAQLFAGPPLPGEGREDLFFYERKNVTLRRGERAYYPLFTASVPYDHLYEWSVTDSRPEVVWHSVRLTNDTAVPWTSAPAVTASEERLLGQDVLPYTAVGARTALRITQALDLEAEQGEIEKARQKNAATIDGYAHDLVTVQGDLRVSNHKKEPVVVEITKLLSGEMVETPPGMEVVTLAERLKKTNPSQRLLVTLPIEPGATASVRYVYKLYIRA